MVRPKRLFIDEKDRPYYIIDKKKVFVKVPNGVTLKQIQKVNIKNIIQQPSVKRVKRRKKRVKPQFQQRLVSSMAPGVLPSSGGLPTYVFQEKKPVQSIEDVQKAFTNREKKLLKDAEIVPQKQTLEIENYKQDKERIREEIRVRQIERAMRALIRGKPGSTDVTEKATQIEELGMFSVPSSPKKKPVLPPIPKTKRSELMPSLQTKVEKEVPGSFTKTEIGRGKGIPKGYHKMPDGTIMKDSEHGAGHDEGLYDDEVERIASKRLKYFVPCIASDETDQLMKYVKRGDKEFAFVINTDPSGTPGRHWTCVYIDNRDDYPSCEFFDPLAEGSPPKAVIDVMRRIASKMNPEKMFKYKYNIIRRQSTRTNNCGHHCIKFLEDRYNGIPFCEASGYDDFIHQHKDKLMGADGSVLGEGEVMKMMPKYNSYI
jgi:hypothetical protein